MLQLGTLQFLFGNDANLSNQLKDLAEATKVSKKLDTKGHKSNGYRGHRHGKSKGFGYKYSSRGQGTQAIKKFKLEKARPPIHKEGRGEVAKPVGLENPPNEVRYLQACRLQQFVPEWKDINDEPEALYWVEHCYLEFIDNLPPVQETDYKVIQFSDAESAIIESEIVKLLNKGVTVEFTHS